MTPARAGTPPPAYCEVGRAPADDAGHFELMTQAIFRAGLNWSVIENKWPAFRTAFAEFDVDRVAGYGEVDAARLREDQSIVRNHRKIIATIDNAIELQRIRSDHGSFSAFLQSLAVDGEDVLVKGVSDRFAHVGPSTAVSFLRSVGYEMPAHAEAWQRHHGGG